VICSSSDNHLWAGYKSGLLEIYLKPKSHVGGAGLMPYNYEMDHRVYKKSGVHRFISEGVENLHDGIIDAHYQRFDEESGQFKLETIKVRDNQINKSLDSDWLWMNQMADLINYNVQDILEDGMKNIWVATLGGGIYQLNRSEFEVKNWNYKEGLTSNEVTSLIEDKEGGLWIGTRDGLCFKPPNSNNIFKIESNMVSKFSIYSLILDDADYLWIGSDKGIIRVSISELKKQFDEPFLDVQWVQLDKWDGMRLSETSSGFQPASCKMESGELWFSTPKGVAVVDPQHLSINEFPPPIYIEALVLQNGKRIDLPIENKLKEINTSEVLVNIWGLRIELSKTMSPI